MNRQKEIISWYLYDFANSAFATIILTVAYGVYFKKTICQGHGGDFLWGLSVALAYFLAAILSPLLGALSDHHGSRKYFLVGMTLLSIGATFLLSFVKAGMIFSGIVLFIISFFGFALGNVFYNSFLLDISTPQNIGKISGLGWGIGYLGGLFTLALSYPWLSKESFPVTFALSAFIFLVFAFPSFIFLKSPAQNSKENFKEALSKSLSRLKETLRNIKQHRPLARFLVAFFFYNDGLSTIITFSSIYAHDTFKMSMKEVTLLFAVIQVTAFAGAAVSGFIVDQIGAKKTILATLFLWIITVWGAYSAPTKAAFWLVSIIAGLGIGSCQSASRSLVGLLTPVHKAGEFFGFFGIFTKCSSILGPLLFGFTSHWLGNQRKAILTVLVFFVIGMILILRVKAEKVENP